ncbi:MAG TPA: retropepsin-like aspartic protease, partial [Novosphingobium sp.]|nr:retropepsin-like aspartic protease [Novosphingobium sp.]
MAINPLLLPLLPLMAAVPVLVGQDGSQQASDVDVIALGRDMHDRMTVPVKVIEQGPFDFLIDTGAQNTVLSTSLAARLSLAPEGRARLIGVAGTEMVDTVQVDQIDLGSRSYYALLSPLLEKTNIGADGILGLDSLQGQRVLIDFRKKLIAVDEARALGGSKGFDIVVTARRRSGQLIMANAKVDGISTDVV